MISIFDRCAMMIFTLFIKIIGSNLVRIAYVLRCVVI